MPAVVRILVRCAVRARLLVLAGAALAGVAPPARIDAQARPARRPANRPARPARPWWADSTRWPPGTFRRTTTTRPAVVIAVGDTLRVAPPVPPIGLADSIARDVRWSADEPRILEVAPAGTPDGIAIARSAGSAIVTAWTRVGPTLTPVRVVARLRGRLLTADGGTVPRAVALVTRRSGRVDTLRTDADARFALPGDATRDPPTHLRIEAGRDYFAVETPLPVPFAGEPTDVVLLPRRWTVPSGTHAGATVAIDLDAARARAADGSRFWRAARLTRDSAAHQSAGPPVGWPDERRPIPVAVGGVHGAPIGTADSLAFWAVARAMEADWGAPLFRPAPAASVRDRDWWGIAVQITPEMPAAGFATISWNVAGEIAHGVVEVRTRALLGDRHIVGHELLHALGFGHVTRWRSVVGGEVHAVDAGPTALSLEDVAYGRLLDAARRVARRSGAAFGLAEAVP